MLVKSPQLSSLALLRKAAAAGWAAHALLCSTISLENRIQLFRVLSLPQASIHLMLCPPTAHTCTHPHTHIHTHTHTPIPRQTHTWPRLTRCPTLVPAELSLCEASSSPLHPRGPGDSSTSLISL